MRRSLLALLFAAACTPPDACEEGTPASCDGAVLATCEGGELSLTECGAAACDAENARCALCGDGVTSPGEACDDENADDSDACPTTCENAFCGDGFVRAGVEECDDANDARND